MKTPLFDPARHEALAGDPWTDDKARAAVARIVDVALEAVDDEGLWPAHPLDDPDQDRYAMLYFGAAGMVWALRELLPWLGRAPIDFTEVVRRLAALNRETTQRWDYGEHAYLMGHTGIDLLEWAITRDAAVADRMMDGVRANLRNPTREALLGSPGSMLAALHMAEATGEARWRALFRDAVDIVWREMEYAHDLRAWLWTQDLYGRRCHYLGAAHGFVGNVYPVVRGAALLEPSVVQGFFDRAIDTLSATALRDGELVNWHALADAELVRGRTPLVQDCHGGPGIVVRLGAMPPEPVLDRLLAGAGELTWVAGPVAKGASLCHGTAGNGWAFLKLHQRSGDPRWLDRARSFAMHAIGQVERHRAQYGQGRHALWTGDVGIALYLKACIDGDAAFPTLDRGPWPARAAS